MEKLKQHYEKIVLGALLLGFVLALVYLLQMVDSARKVTAEDLKFTAPNKAYEKQDFSSEKFSIEHMLGKRADWSDRDTSKHGYTSGLSVPMKALRCENSDCLQIIPWSLVRSKAVCPFCGEKLSDPGTPPDHESEIAKLDTDADGMPDRYELKMGFNPNDPNDADQDRDMDGFSNVYEFMVKTDPTNAKSFPSLEKCLFLVKLIKKTMPLTLNGVTVIDDPSNKNSKKNWDINLTVNRMRETLQIGGEFEVSGRRYKILDADFRTSDAQQASVVLDNDASRVTIAPVKGGKVDEKGKMIIEVGKKVYEPDHQAMLVDIRDMRKVYRKNAGESVTLKGADGEKGTTFQVIATDPVKETARMLNTETNEEFLLETKSRIPRNAYVGRGGGMDAGMGGSVMAPGMPGGMMNNAPAAPAPRTRRRVRN